jgi:hypothetical protein
VLQKQLTVTPGTVPAGDRWPYLSIAADDPFMAAASRVRDAGCDGK